jgi:hypothetical protein
MLFTSQNTSTQPSFYLRMALPPHSPGLSELILMSPPSHRPPVSLVVFPGDMAIHQPPSQLPDSFSEDFIIPSSIAVPTPTSPSSMLARFSLQPRQSAFAPRSASVGIRSDDTLRGRKRRAQAITMSPFHDSEDSSEDDHCDKSKSLDLTDAETLSVTSVRKDSFSSTFTKSSPSRKDCSLLKLMDLTLQSPHSLGNHEPHASPMSAFRTTRFPSSSPASSVACTEAETNVTTPASKYIPQRSPRLAPIKVLTDSKLPARPPLHARGAFMHSHHLSTPRSEKKGVSSVPHQQHHHSSSHFTPPSIHMCPRSDNSSLTTFHGLPEVSFTRTPRSASSRKKRATMGSASPHETPLPCISLTPRSTVSRGRHMPSFPSPWDCDVLSPSEHMNMLQSEIAGEKESELNRETSFMPVASAAASLPKTITFGNQSSPNETNYHYGNNDDNNCRYNQSKSTSLLAPPNMNELTSWMQQSDDASLSDDEAFLLYSPDDIAEKKRAARVPLKQAKIEGLASQTSLHGMHFLSSNANLKGLEGESGESAGAWPAMNECGSLSIAMMRSDSIGLTWDACEGGRDLVTPPAMPVGPALSPPPLSPHMEKYETP